MLSLGESPPDEVAEALPTAPERHLSLTPPASNRWLLFPGQTESTGCESLPQICLGQIPGWIPTRSNPEKMNGIIPRGKCFSPRTNSSRLARINMGCPRALGKVKTQDLSQVSGWLGYLVIQAGSPAWTLKKIHSGWLLALGDLLERCL